MSPTLPTKAEAVYTPAENARDAERYRAWRDNMLNEDPKFLDAMQDALPAEVGASRPPTAAEWDAALDIAAGLRMEAMDVPSRVPQTTQATLPDVRAAWDKYRDGVELPMDDAFVFAAGYIAATNDILVAPMSPPVPWDQLTAYTRDSNKTVAMETELLAWRSRGEFLAKRLQVPADIKAIHAAVVAARPDDRLSLAQRVAYMAGIHHAAREVSVFAFRAGQRLSGPAATMAANTESALAAIEFALKTGCPMEFLQCWHERDFATIRKEWPAAPVAVFGGADPDRPESIVQGAHDAVARLSEPRIDEIWHEVEQNWASGAASQDVNRHVLYARAIERELVGENAQAHA